MAESAMAVHYGEHDATFSWPFVAEPAKIALTVTIHSPDLHPSREFIEPPPSRSGRFWVLFGALGVSAGLALAAWSLMDDGKQPGPNSEPPLSALAALSPAEEEPSGNPTRALLEPPSTESSKAGSQEAEVTGPAKSETPKAEGAGPQTAFYVQVASYKSEADADAYSVGLSGRGLRAETFVDPSAPSWHKVRLGPFRSRADAESARFALQVNERRSAYVMPRSNGKYHVQVASFATRAEAEPVAARLAAQGHSTKVTRVKMGERRWHCVRIGPFDTAEEAESYKELVDDVPGTESTVIPYGPPKL